LENHTPHHCKNGEKSRNNQGKEWLERMRGKKEKKDKCPEKIKTEKEKE
jgi:hypothetical protein